MDQKEIDIEVRLYALEIMAANQLSIYCLSCGMPPLEALEKLKKQLREGAQKKTFPDFDAAMSDLLAAELENALAALTTMADQQIRHFQDTLRKNLGKA